MYKVWFLDDMKCVFSRSVTYKENECYNDILDKESITHERNTAFLDIVLGILDSGGDVQSEGDK